MPAVRLLWIWLALGYLNALGAAFHEMWIFCILASFFVACCTFALALQYLKRVQ